MIEEMVIMAGMALPDISIPTLLVQWEKAGLFSYILPFLVIFAVVFGLLERLQIFGGESRGVNAVISTAVGLLSLQFNFVGTFFSQLFPRFGIGVAILLIAMVFLGLFIENKMLLVFFWVGAIVGLGVLGTTFQSLGWFTGGIDTGNIAGLVLIGGVILLIYSMTSKERNWTTEPNTSPLARVLGKVGTGKD